MSATPWIVKELCSLGVVDSSWNLSWIALRERNYLLELTFRDRRLIVKCLRKQTSGRADATRFLSNELRVLRILESLHREALIPKLAPLPFGEYLSQGIWVQECLPGLPLRSIDVLSRHDRQEMVLSHLRCLGKVGRGAPLTLEELMRELPAGSPSSLRYRIASRAAERLASKLQPCLGHNDLNPSNILLHDQSLAFADWTFSKERGQPCFDWFDLVSHTHRDSRHLSWCDLASSVADCSSALIADYLRGANFLLDQAEKAQDILQLYLATRFANLVNRYHPEAGEVAVNSMLSSQPWLENPAA